MGYPLSGRCQVAGTGRVGGIKRVRHFSFPFWNPSSLRNVNTKTWVLHLRFVNLSSRGCHIRRAEFERRFRAASLHPSSGRYLSTQQL